MTELTELFIINDMDKLNCELEQQVRSKYYKQLTCCFVEILIYGCLIPESLMKRSHVMADTLLKEKV